MWPSTICVPYSCLYERCYQCKTETVPSFDDLVPCLLYWMVIRVLLLLVAYSCCLVMSHCVAVKLFKGFIQSSWYC